MIKFEPSNGQPSKTCVDDRGQQPRAPADGLAATWLLFDHGGASALSCVLTWELVLLIGWPDRAWTMAQPGLRSDPGGGIMVTRGKIRWARQFIVLGAAIVFGAVACGGNSNSS